MCGNFTIKLQLHENNPFENLIYKSAIIIYSNILILRSSYLAVSAAVCILSI